MSGEKPLSREQLKALAMVHEEASDTLREKLKSAPSEAERDALFRQMIKQSVTAMDYRDQANAITLSLAVDEAKNLVSMMSAATKRLQEIQKTDDLVYFSGRLLQAAAIIASASVGGGPAVVAAIATLLKEAADETA